MDSKDKNTFLFIICKVYLKNIPILPAIAEPIMFFDIFKSTKVCVVVFKMEKTTSAEIIHSQTTDFPLPSIQFTADGFLSVQTFPLRLSISISGNFTCISFSAFSVPFDTMFIPMASPVSATNLMNKYRPAMWTVTLRNFANLLVELKLFSILTKFEASAIHILASVALTMEEKRTTGPRVMPSATSLLFIPLFSIARQPSKENYLLSSSYL